MEKTLADLIAQVDEIYTQLHNAGFKHAALQALELEHALVELEEELES